MNAKRAVSILLTVVVVLAAHEAFASSAGMPWEGPLNRLLQSLTGPVAKAVGVFSIVGLGFGIAFSEGAGIDDGERCSSRGESAWSRKDPRRAPTTSKRSAGSTRTSPTCCPRRRAAASPPSFANPGSPGPTAPTP